MGEPKCAQKPRCHGHAEALLSSSDDPVVLEDHVGTWDEHSRGAKSLNLYCDERLAPCP